jgi:hypothetical protein
VTVPNPYSDYCRTPATIAKLALRIREAGMARCAQCGNDYDKTFEVTLGGRTMVFDSFECAIQMLAPICPHCGCRVVGHGVEHNGVIFCCAHCARREGIKGLVDRG